MGTSSISPREGKVCAAGDRTATKTTLRMTVFSSRSRRVMLGVSVHSRLSGAPASSAGPACVAPTASELEVQR